MTAGVEDPRPEIHIVPVQRHGLAYAHAGHGEEPEHCRVAEAAQPLGRQQARGCRDDLDDLLVAVDVRRRTLIAAE